MNDHMLFAVVPYFGLVAFILSPHGRLLQGALIDADGGLTKTI